MYSLLNERLISTKFFRISQILFGFYDFLYQIKTIHLIALLPTYIAQEQTSRALNLSSSSISKSVALLCFSSSP